MNAVQENKVSMYFKVRTFFGNNLTNLTGDAPSLTAQVARFETMLQALGEFDMEAVENTQGYSIQKQNTRTTLRTSALGVAGSLYAFAKDSNDDPLASKCYTTKSTLDAKRDTDMLYWCERLFAMATDNAAAIVPFGTSAAKLTALDTAVQTFKQIIQNPADQRAESAAAGIEVDKKIVEIDSRLRLIDGIMDGIAEDYPTLYNQYFFDRRIDDNASGVGTPDVVELIEKGSTEMIYEVPYLSSRTFKLKNKGTASIQWGLSSAADAFSGASYPIDGGQTSSFLSSTFGTEGNYLLVSNPQSVDITVELTIDE